MVGIHPHFKGESAKHAPSPKGGKWWASPRRSRGRVWVL